MIIVNIFLNILSILSSSKIFKMLVKSFENNGRNISKNIAVILKYATTHNHLQPPTTIDNRRQPSKTIRNHPKLS